MMIRERGARLLVLLLATVAMGGCVTAGASPAVDNSSPAVFAPSPPETDGASLPNVPPGQALSGSMLIQGQNVSQLTPSGFRLSQDGGKNWSDIALPSGVSPQSVMAVSAVPSRRIFVATADTGGKAIHLYGRPANDSTWTAARLSPSWPSDSSVTGPADSVTITLGPSGFVAVTGSVRLGTALAFNALFVSQDDGKTFVQRQSASPDANIVWDSVAFATPLQGVVVVGPTNEDLIHSADGGANWTKAVLPKLPTVGSFTFGDPVVVGSSIEVPMLSQAGANSNAGTFSFLVSNDGGATFADGPSLNLPDGESVSASVGQRTWVVSSSGATIYESSDNGLTWASVKASGLPQNLSSLSLTGSDSATASVVTRGCTGFKTGCWQKMYLVQTTNGGHTWTAV